MKNQCFPSAIVLGAGSMIANILPAIDRSLLNITSLIDERPHRQHSFFSGIPIGGMDTIMRSSYDYILVACRPTNKIIERLIKDCHVPENKIIPLDFEVLFLGESPPQSKDVLFSQVQSYFSQWPDLYKSFSMDVFFESPWIKRIMKDIEQALVPSREIELDQAAKLLRGFNFKVQHPLFDC